MRHRLQMGTTRTSDAEQIDNMQKTFVLNEQDRKSISITEDKTNALLDEPKRRPIVYTMKIRGGRSVDSKGHSAGKGALIQENLSATLGVTQDQYLFQPIRGGRECYSIDEKMGNTYVWNNQANTLASRDYKQPQAVLVRKENK